MYVMITKYQIIILAMVCTLNNHAGFSQTLSVAPYTTQSWPANIVFCSVNAPGDKQWSTTNGSFVCMGCGPNYPVTIQYSSAPCNTVEVFYYDPFYTLTVGVSISGTFGSASASSILIPETWGQVISTPGIQSIGCADNKISLDVTDQEFSDPSGLSRTGPYSMAKFPFKWKAKNPVNGNWETVLNEPGQVNISPPPSTPLNDVRVRFGSLFGNPIVDSAFYSNGKIDLHLGSLPDSLNGVEIVFELNNFQGHYMYSDTVILDIQPVHKVDTLITNPQSGFMIPGFVSTHSINQMPMHSYKWSVEGGSIMSGQGTDSISVKWGQPSQNSFIRVVSERGDCKDSTDFPIVVTFLDVEQFDGSNLSLDPVPSNSEIKASIKNFHEPSEYEIYSSQGELVEVGIFNQDVNFINVEAYKPGLYFLVVQFDSEALIEKIIVN